MMATIYKEIQGATARVARWRGMNYVLRASDPHKPQAGTDPNSVMASMNETVVYADPSNDITKDVVYFLNRWYEGTKNTGAASKPAARRPGAATDGVAADRELIGTRGWRSGDRSPLPAVRAETVGSAQIRLPRPSRGLEVGASGPAALGAWRRGSGSIQDEMKGQGMLRATRRQRTIARSAEVRGVGFFHGADVTIRFHPAEPDAGIVFQRSDLPGRPTIPARIDSVAPSQRRTTIRRDGASVEMIEHVMAALAGLQIDNAVVEIDAGECPGCDGSSQVFVEALDRAGIVEQDRMRPALVVQDSISIREGDAVLAIHPPGSGRRLDALLPPRLRPRGADPLPEFLRRPLRGVLPDRAGAQPHLPARDRGQRASRRRDRRADHPGRPPALRSRRRRR